MEFEQFANNALLTLAVVIAVVILLFILSKMFKKRRTRNTPTSIDTMNNTTAEDLWLEMAQSYEKSGNIEKALEHYEIYLFKSKSADAELHFHVGNLFGKEAIESAVKYWKEAASLGYQPAIDKLMNLGPVETKKDEDEELFT